MNGKSGGQPAHSMGPTMSAKEPALPNMVECTAAFEKWAARHVNLIRTDVDRKHLLMASAPFPFFRATFYRWAQWWPILCPDLAGAPQVLAVGDLHVENFGTWRDFEGRLIWGVNDFDEAWPAAYTVDLARLLTSAYLAMEAEHLSLSHKEAREAIEQGYRDSLARGGGAFILAEHHRWLRLVALNKLRDPVVCWKKILTCPGHKGQLPKDVWRLIHSSMPLRTLNYELKSRIAGLGSLGHPRIVALATWDGAHIAREAKQLTPSAWIWARGCIARKSSAASWWNQPDAFRTRTCTSRNIGLCGASLPIAATSKFNHFPRSATKSACCITWDGRRPTFTSAVRKRYPQSNAMWPAAKAGGYTKPPNPC
jgi:Uncharacterized protein conserved in bacteria (DUF2252)